MVSDPGSHCRCDAERFVQATEIVKRKPQRDCRPVILPFLLEGICQAREAPDAHANTQLAAFYDRRTDAGRIGTAHDGDLYDFSYFRRRVPRFARLKGWKYNPAGSKRPMQMAQITIDSVFDRIGPGLTKELRKRRDELFGITGKRGKLHQALTTDVGHPALGFHLAGLTFSAKMFVDGNWKGFYEAIERAYPRYNRTMPFPFEDAGNAA